MLPILFSINGISFYSYPLFLGIAVGHFFFSSYKKLPKKNLIFFLLGTIISAWIGAKITFFLVNKYVNIEHDFVSLKVNWDEYLHTTNFWFGGGFVFYGGLIAGLLFVLAGSKIFKIIDEKNIYLICPVIAYSHAIGRVGCFMAGCCHGINNFPIQLIEAAFLTLLGICLDFTAKRFVSNNKIFLMYLGVYTMFRFVIEFFRGDSSRGIFGYFSVSQYISIVVFLTVLLIGVLGCCFSKEVRHDRQV